MIQEGKDRRDVSLLHWVITEGEALLQLLFLRNVQVKKARPRLRDYESWLPLAAEAKSRNLGPIFFIISVCIQFPQDETLSLSVCFQRILS